MKDYPDVVTGRNYQQEAVEILRERTNQMPSTFFVIGGLDLQSFFQRRENGELEGNYEAKEKL